MTTRKKKNKDMIFFLLCAFIVFLFVIAIIYFTKRFYFLEGHQQGFLDCADVYLKAKYG